jgi:ABC-type lipoprotein release transport system permease subunit
VARVAAGVVAVAVLASWVPAVRATRYEPSEALPAE